MLALLDRHRRTLIGGGRYLTTKSRRIDGRAPGSAEVHIRSKAGRSGQNRREYRALGPQVSTADLPRLVHAGSSPGCVISGAAPGARSCGICCAARKITERRSVGHSHVLAPELSDPLKSKDVARRLTLKAPGRLRQMEYFVI